MVDPDVFEPLDVRALSLQLGKASVAVGLELVDRIVEAPCAPLPLTHPLVRGIAFDAARPIVCVFLSRRPASAESSTITAVVLAGGGPVAWALCADQVLGVVTLVGRSRAADPRLPRWLRRARTADGRVVAWLDPARMIDDIASEERAA